MKRVLLTGITGFVGPHVALFFLDRGWTVRATTRSSAKSEAVLELPLLRPYAQTGALEAIVVCSVETGDFGAALEGVDAVVHLASPFHFKGTQWERDYREPAVAGTTNIIRQAAAVKSIRAVCILSSFVAMAEMQVSAYEQAGRVYDENDWFSYTEDRLASIEPSSQATILWYSGSKKYAELAAFATAKKYSATFALSTILPPLILGPPIHMAAGSGPDFMAADPSTAMMYSALCSGEKAPMPDTAFPTYADVRNVAEAIFNAVVRGACGRFAVCNGIYDWQMLADLARAAFPHFTAQIPVGTPGKHPTDAGTYSMNVSKSIRSLGVQYLPMQVTVRDIMDQMSKLGAV